MFSAGRRLLGTALLVVGCSLTLASPATAAPYTDPTGLVYVADPDDVEAGARVTDYVGSTTDLTIPASVAIEGVTYAVRAIGDFAFANGVLTSVTLPGTVTSVGTTAFRNNALSRVDLGPSVRVIGDNAFAENDLTTLVIPDSVITIGGAAFYNNHLSDVRFGRRTTAIDNFAFSNNSLPTLDLPASVTSIGIEAFSNNQELHQVTFRGAVPTTFTAKAPAGSLGNGNDPVVLYDPAFAGADEDTGFTRPSWRGYRSSPAWFVVSFDTGSHGVAPGQARVPYAGSLVRPTDPTAAGWTFEGWYVDPALTVPYPFGQVVTADQTLHARWVAVPRTPEEPTPDGRTHDTAPPPIPTDPPDLAPVATPEVAPEVTPTTATAVGAPLPPSSAVPTPAVRAGGGDDPIEAKPRAPDPDRSDPRSPSAISDALPSLKDVLTDPERVLRAFSSGFVLSLLVFLTAGVFNRLLERRTYTWSAWLRAKPVLGSAVARIEDWTEANPVGSAVLFTGMSGGVLAAVDPDFGWDVVSMRLAASAIAAILVGLVGCLWLVSVIADRRLRIRVDIRGIPAGVLLAVAGVVASRALDFQPGFLIGAIIGLTVAGGEPQVAKVEELRASTTLVIAGAAWIATDLIDPTGLVSAFAGDALVVVVTALLCGLLLRLLPFPGFPGAVILRHARARWAGLFTLTAFAFLTIVLPRPGNWLYVGDRVDRWLLLTGLFAALTLALYVLDVRGLRRERASSR